VIWSAKIHLCLHMSPPPVDLILSQSNPFHVFVPRFSKAYVNITASPKESLLLGLSDQNSIYNFYFSMFSTCRTHFILFCIVTPRAKRTANYGVPRSLIFSNRLIQVSRSKYFS
jgi:hypothetical protein